MPRGQTWDLARTRDVASLRILLLQTTFEFARNFLIDLNLIALERTSQLVIGVARFEIRRSLLNKLTHVGDFSDKAQLLAQLLRGPSLT
jgi:hypothetical protein